MKSTTTRRSILRGGPLATIAALAAAPALATPTIASAISPDPVVNLAERYREALRRYDAAVVARDRAEAAARERDCYPAMPSMTVGVRFCLDVEQVREAAAEAGFDAQRQHELAEVMQQRLADYREQRRAAGLLPFDQEDEEAGEVWSSILAEIAHTPAATVAGLAQKIRLLGAEIREGDSVHGEALADSALQDALRLAKGGVA